MKFKNEGESFSLTFDSRDIEIPCGIFTVNDDELAKHIIYICSKWGKKVVNFDSSASKKIEIDPISSKEQVKLEEMEKEIDDLNKAEGNPVPADTPIEEKKKPGRKPKV